MLGPLKTSIHLVVSETKSVEISEILERKGSKKGQTQKRWVFPTLSRMNSGTHCCKVEEDHGRDINLAIATNRAVQMFSEYLKQEDVEEIGSES